jgi:hypothetical protein
MGWESSDGDGIILCAADAEDLGIEIEVAEIGGDHE